MSEKISQVVEAQRYSADTLEIDISDVSEGAMLVCETLQNNGYDGYLVGGCVRDWMLGLHPKDLNARALSAGDLSWFTYITNGK